MSKNGEVSSNQGNKQANINVEIRAFFVVLSDNIRRICYNILGPSRPTMPKPELNLFGLEKRKGLNLQIAGGPSGGAAFMPFPANPPPVQRPRVPSRTIRDVLPENAR